MNQKFDMIHDSECLTNTINANDRAAFLEGIKKSLVANGKFVVTVAVQSKQYIPEESFESIRLDEEHILWRDTLVCDIPGVVEHDNKFWVAQKRVMPAHVVRQELQNAGFEIVNEEMEVRADARALLRLVLNSIEGCYLVLGRYVP